MIREGFEVVGLGGVWVALCWFSVGGVMVCDGLILCEAVGGCWCGGAWLVGAGLVDPLPCSLWLVVRGEARR